MNEGNVPINQKLLKEGDFSREAAKHSMEEMIDARDSRRMRWWSPTT